MRFWFLLLFIFISCSKNQNEFLLKVKYGNIVGGTDVSPSDSIQYSIVNIGEQCGGTIIAEKWILTAGHCARHYYKPITAYALTNSDANTITLKGVQAVYHPDYNPRNSSYDIALIELESSIDFENSPLKPMPLAFSTMELSEGVMLKIFGWGKTSEEGEYSKNLKVAEVPFVRLDIANAPESYNGVLNDSMIAAGFKAGGVDTCQKDSGGPLILEDEVTHLKVQVGVVSFGYGCARPNLYGIYASIPKAMEWIENTIKALPTAE